MERRTGSCSAEPFWVDMVVGKMSEELFARCVEERRSVGGKVGMRWGLCFLPHLRLIPGHVVRCTRNTHRADACRRGVLACEMMLFL
jgi:hypothetical protein